MTASISAIFFDVGGTLRRNTPRDPAARAVGARQILGLLGSSASADDFAQTLAARADAYEEWAAATLTELDESRLWTEWMVPEYPPGQIRPLALQLNQIWRETIATRALFPETVPALHALHLNGYRLGLISNTTSPTDALDMFTAAGIASLFEVVLLSCVFGRRKPDPAILIAAADRMGVPPGRCAYIGDRLDWDVCAARAAGFGLAVLVRAPVKPVEVEPALDLTPDLSIDHLLELLPIFPPRIGRVIQSEG